MWVSRTPVALTVAAMALVGMTGAPVQAAATGLGGEQGKQELGPDFDADGFGDQAVGVPNEGPGATGSGVVHVLYGTAGGLSASGTQLWSQDSAGVADEPEESDGFGSALAWGDFDGDGFDDLAIGAPGEGAGKKVAEGVVHVLFGSGDGLTSAGSQVWSQSSAGVADDPEKGDLFGAELLARDFNSDGTADLVIGAWGEDDAAGAVHVLFGSGAGVTATGSQLWRQLTGTPEKDDNFGFTLAAGDLDGDGNQDLAVGVPSEDDGAQKDTGAVNVLYGSPTGLKAAGNQFWDHTNAGSPVKSPKKDIFGVSLAIGRFNADAISDLAIGVPNQKAGYSEAGAVRLLYGTPDGLSATGAEEWTQDSEGVLDETASREHFGRALIAADFDSDGFHDLAVGVPGECLDDPCQNIGEGAVNVLRGSSTGLTGDGDQFWTQDSPGVLESGESGDHFGDYLSRGDANGDGLPDLLIANTWEDLGGVWSGGDLHVLYATAEGLEADGNQVWSQNSAGIPDTAEDYDYFGSSLLSN